MTVDGAVLVDLRGVPSRRQRWLVGGLQMAPDGCRVALMVGDEPVDITTISLLREHTERLRLQVLGSPEAVASWCAALRGEDLFWPADVWSPRQPSWAAGGAA